MPLTQTLVAGAFALSLGQTEPATTTATTTTSTSSSSEAERTWRGGFDRVDLISEDLGTWLHYDVPMAPHNVQAVGLRFVEQVKVSFRLPVKGLYAGASLSSQSLTYEHPLLGGPGGHGLYATGGLQTRLLLPRGVTAGVAWRWGHVRVGASLAAFSETSWSRPNWQQWTFLPTLGVGVGAGH